MREKGLIEKLFANLQKNSSDKTAFIFEETETRRVTFGEFADDVYRSMSELEGICDQSIALIAGNSYSWIKCFFSIILSNNIAVLIDPEETEQKIRYMIKAAGCSYVYMENRDSLITTVNSSNAGSKYNEGFLFGCVMDVAETENVQDDKYNIVIYTSGSTGLPKGVMLTSDGMLENASSFCRRVVFEEGIFLTLPFHHAYALAVGILANIYCRNWICIETGNVNFEKIRRTGTRSILAVPAIVEFIQNQIEVTGGKNVIGQLHQIICGGAFLREETEFFCMKNNLDLIIGYGMTECGTVIAVESTNDKRTGSVGKALDCYEIKINEEIEEECGEIIVKGNSLMRGYLNRSKKTHVNNYFETGDLGFIDNDEFLYIIFIL